MPRPRSENCTVPDDVQGSDKYKHIYATHATSRPSTLSHDAISTPSFIGFRNLMVIVLSMPLPAPSVCAGSSDLSGLFPLPFSCRQSAAGD